MKATFVKLALGLLLAVAMSGCAKKKAKDIVVSDLKTVCDHVDAMGTVVDEIAGLVGDATSKDQLSDQQKQDLDALNAKGEEIGDALREKGTREEARACSSFAAFEEKGRKLEEFLD